MSEQGKLPRRWRLALGAYAGKKMITPKKRKDVSNVCHFRQSAAASLTDAATLPWRLLSKHIIIRHHRRRLISVPKGALAVYEWVCVCVVAQLNFKIWLALFHRLAKYDEIGANRCDWKILCGGGKEQFRKRPISNAEPLAKVWMKQKWRASSEDLTLQLDHRAKWRMVSRRIGLNVSFDSIHESQMLISIRNLRFWRNRRGKSFVFN